jgi:hypothetical protein
MYFLAISSFPCKKYLDLKLIKQIVLNDEGIVTHRGSLNGMCGQYVCAGFTTVI